jgi:glyoxylase-like metal-dependent hydrolase (beta-lactamase superfamily II)
MEPKINVIEVLPNLHLFRFPVGQAYLWRDDHELTLIDTGLAGFGAAISAAITDLGLDPHDLTRIVITHFHQDHTGSLAELTAWSDAEVIAHGADAPHIRGHEPGPMPVLNDAEQAFVSSLPPMPQAPPARVGTEADDGDVLDFGGGARVLWVPGHTNGSIALHLPDAGVVFTGDTVGAGPDRIVSGPFNLDPDLAYTSLQRIAGLGARIACFGHGDPLLDNAAERIACAERHPF